MSLFKRFFAGVDFCLGLYFLWWSTEFIHLGVISVSILNLITACLNFGTGMIMLEDDEER